MTCCKQNRRADAIEFLNSRVPYEPDPVLNLTMRKTLTEVNVIERLEEIQLEMFGVN